MGPSLPSLDKTGPSLPDPALQPSSTQFTNPCDPRNVQVVEVNTAPVNMRMPSAGWLRNPAWIDGGVNPPQYYYSHAEIEAACRGAGVEPPPRYSDSELPAAPSQLADDINRAMGVPAGVPLATQYDLLSSRVSPTPVVANNHYRAVDQPGNDGGREHYATNLGAPDKHLVNITHVFTAIEPATSRSTKAAAKKRQITMLGDIALPGITRVDFITAYLTVHGLHTQYAPGVHSGPAFKLSWTGSAGGKSNAPTFLTDENFNLALAAILKKDKKKLQISVEFDTDTMAGYRIQSLVQAAPSSVVANNGDEELVYGNKIPHVSQFNDAEQVNGRFVLEIKKRWPCAAHYGEHGEAGHCFITASGEHLRLNPLRLKMWAAAMASGDATKHEPPCTEAFDGPRNGQASSVRARGRTGATAAVTGPAPASSDVMALLMASLIPVIGGLSRKRSRSRSRSNSTGRYASRSQAHGRTPKRVHHEFETPIRSQPVPQTPKAPRRDFQTPTHRRSFQSPSRTQPLFPSLTQQALQSPLGTQPSTPPFPSLTQPALRQFPASPVLVPAPGFELRACLRDFAELEGVDMTAYEIALRAEDFTPDVIMFADESATIAIRSITGATAGRLMRLKLFCKQWQTNYENKLLSGSFTTYELE